jgi:two-component system chemotaxis response regulator CheB
MPGRAAAQAPAWRSRDAVVIGGSLGAVQALRELLPQLPADYRLPVIIILHQYRHNSESFWRLLAEYCALPVSAIEDKAPILPGQIYVAPANYHVLIEPARSFALSTEPPVNFARPAIDVTFESAAHVYGARSVGVLLSGASSDGALGLRCIKEAGGATFCQLPSDSIEGTMPRAGCAATAVDRIASPESLGRQLLEFSR